MKPPGWSACLLIDRVRMARCRRRRLLWPRCWNEYQYQTPWACWKTVQLKPFFSKFQRHSSLKTPTDQCNMSDNVGSRKWLMSAIFLSAGQFTIVSFGIGRGWISRNECEYSARWVTLFSNAAEVASSTSGRNKRSTLLISWRMHFTLNLIGRMEEVAGAWIPDDRQLFLGSWQGHRMNSKLLLYWRLVGYFGASLMSLCPGVLCPSLWAAT